MMFMWLVGQPLFNERNTHEFKDCNEVAAVSVGLPLICSNVFLWLNAMKVPSLRGELF